ncbi:hypothetical protein [Desulfobacula phenolica]|nr:hypothetical protein [Desulfobacula phenolica]
MGAKPVFKRYENIVYFACCIVIGLFLSGCRHAALLRDLPYSIDTNEKKYLIATQRLVSDMDFQSAERETQRILEYYSGVTGMNDIILSNYIENTRIISNLLTRIMEDEKKKQAFIREIRLKEEKITALTLTAGSLKKKADVQQEQLADMEKVVEKLKFLENEKNRLQKQIEQLKQIDLNPDKIIGKPDPA